RSEESKQRDPGQKQGDRGKIPDEKGDHKKSDHGMFAHEGKSSRVGVHTVFSFCLCSTAVMTKREARPHCALQGASGDTLCSSCAKDTLAPCLRTVAFCLL